MEPISDEEDHDINKMADLIVSLTALKTKYVFKTEKFQKLQMSTNTLIDKINNYILETNKK